MPTHNIYRDGEQVASGIEGNSYTDSGLDPNTEYSYQVSAVNEAGESDLSEPVTVTTGYAPVESVSVSPKTNNLEVGGTRQLNVTIEPDTADQSVDWATSNRSIVAVDDNGLIEAVTAGSANIEATAGDITESVSVNVTEPVEVTTDEVTETENTVEYTTEERDTDELPVGESRTVQEGQDGYDTVTYEVTYEDGEEVSREEISRETTEPVTEIIENGTYEEPPEENGDGNTEGE